MDTVGEINETVATWLNAARSLRSVSDATGIERRKLAKAKAGECTLTVHELISLSEHLGQSVRDLLPRSRRLEAVDGLYQRLGDRLGTALLDVVEVQERQRGSGLTVEAVAAWHASTAGRLYLAPEVSSHTVAFSPVDHPDDDPHVVGVGRKSMSVDKIAEATGTDVHCKDVETFIANNIPAETRGRLMQSYMDLRAPLERRYFEREMVYMTGPGQGNHATYLTLLMRGTWLDETPVIWNFSTEILTRAATEAELAATQGYQGPQ